MSLEPLAQKRFISGSETWDFSRLIQNKCLRYWMDNKGVSKYDLNKYCKVLTQEFKFANELNSMARQSSADNRGDSRIAPTLPSLDFTITARKKSRVAKVIQITSFLATLRDLKSIAIL